MDEQFHDDVLSRVPPQNIEAEASVLGAILLENSAINQAREILSHQDFYRESHREIFRAMVELRQGRVPIDAVTLCEALKTKGLLGQIGGPGYIAELADAVPTAATVAHYAKIVREKAVLRSVASIGTQIATMAFEGSADVDASLELASRELEQIRARLAGDPDFPEPDMSLVNHGRRPAPRFPVDCMPEGWRGWIRTHAECAGAPVDYVATALLAGVAALLGNARCVQAWPGWTEPSVLWIANVGIPSSNKSPAQDPAFRLLRNLEVDLAATFPERLRAWETSQLTANARRDSWERDVRAAVASNGTAPILPDDAVEPAKPRRPRILVQDTTPEALARTHSANPRGLIFHRDELAGWFGSFDRYSGNGAERAFWLEAYGGRPYVVDRVKNDGDIIAIRHLAISVFGNIQPDRLANSLLSGEDDGLAGRFAFSWPEPTPPTRPTVSADDAPALDGMRRILGIPLHEAGPAIVPLADPAADIFQNWRVAHASAEGEFSGLFLSALGKMPGLVLRLALILEHLGWSLNNDSQPPTEIVHSIPAAIRLTDDYFKPMAARVFGDAALPDAERNAAAVARLIAHRRIGMPNERGKIVINARDLLRRKLPGLRRAEQVRAAFAALTEGGWIRPIAGRASAGRERVDFEVNPRVFLSTPLQTDAGADEGSNGDAAYTEARARDDLETF